MKTPFIETDRILLRRWKPEDLHPFSRLNSDPRVMEFFLSRPTEKESEDLIRIFEDKFEKHGFCFWAAELKSTREWIGFVGLNVPYFQAHFTPCVEIGWRLAYEHWGKSYAPEAAVASLRYGFEALGLKEIVSFTTAKNLKSRRVMEKIGMNYDSQDDFEHPLVPEGHPLRRHVLYRIKPA